MTIRTIDCLLPAAALALASGLLASPALADTDPLIMFDGFEGCDPVQASIGPAGGRLRLCGAQLDVPAGAVSETTLFGIERLAAPPAAPFDMESAGPAFRFTPADRAFPAMPSVRVPREDSRRGGLAFLDDASNDLFLIEACQQSASGVQQFVNGLGTFAAVRFQGDLPTSTQGLGDGWVRATADTVHTEYDLDAPGNNWAIYAGTPDGGRNVTISAMKELPDFAFEFVKLDIAVNADLSSGSMTQISQLGSVNGSFIVGLMGDASITFAESVDGRIRADITATLVNGPRTLPFVASIDVAAERFLFPPSLSCPDSPPG